MISYTHGGGGYFRARVSKTGRIGRIIKEKRYNSYNHDHKITNFKAQSMRYKIKSFIIRFKRACNWFWFIFKQPKWQEYESFLEIMEKRLIDMATEFETKQITTSSLQDSKNMLRAANLLKKYRTQHYEEKYIDAHWNKCKHMGDHQGGFDDTYSQDMSMKHVYLDKMCLKLALKIIGENIDGWWQ